MNFSAATGGLMFLFGTRPEAIKLCPLFLALARESVPFTVVDTGQHHDMVAPVLRYFGCPAHEQLQLAHPNQMPLSLIRLLLERLPPLFAAYRPAMVAVHGDTASAFGSALCAYLAGIPVCHVEAGLRTGDPYAPFPEEAFRVGIDGMASLCFAPTVEAEQQLLREGHTARIIMTGNTATDALRLCVSGAWELQESLAACRPLLAGTPPLALSRGQRLVLMTVHRRELEEEALHRLLLGIRGAFAERRDVRVLFPVHPSPRVRRAAVAALGDCPNVHLIEPLPLPHMGRLLSRSALLLTDSGGLQEEAVFLGIPTLVLRQRTERPEGVAARVLCCVGVDADVVESSITALLDDEQALARMAHPSPVFGDGFAAERMVAAWKASEWGPSAS